MILFFRAFPTVSNEVLVDAVNDLIANRNSPPMLEEFSKAIAKAQNVADSRNRPEYGFGKASFGGILHHAATVNKTAAKEFVKACCKLIDEKLSQKISPEEYRERFKLICTAADKLDPPHVERRVPVNATPIRKPYRDITGEKDDE